MADRGAAEQTVLVTGVRGRLAGLVAAALQAQPDVCVVGFDCELPDAPLHGVALYRGALREQPIRNVLEQTGATTVVHLAQHGEEQPAQARGNIVSTMELLAACAATGVQRVVLRSSTLVYGTGPEQPLFLDESAPLHMAEANDLVRDYAEIERFSAAFARKQHHIALVTLRLAGIVGGGVSSPLARYLTQPLPRTRLGFDPLVQVLHAEDAAAAIALSALADVQGVFNVAAAPPLTLGQALVLAGRRAVPLAEPLFDTRGPLRKVLRPLAGSLPFAPTFLKYPCVADICPIKDALGFAARYSAHEALRELRAEWS